MNNDSDDFGGWTDDMTIKVAPEHTLEDLVEFVVQSERRGTRRCEVLQILTTRFALSFADAVLALDRIEGGRVRAGMGAVNMPNPDKDPVAYISYHRAMGAPPPIIQSAETDVWRKLVSQVQSGHLVEASDYAASEEFVRHCHPHEGEAATLWCRAVNVDPGGTRPARTSSTAVRVLALAEAMGTTTGRTKLLRNVLLQAGTAISTVGESRIKELGEQRYAPAGTPAWFDAIRLSEAAACLSALFRTIDDGANEMAALEVRGRMTTRMLGHCHHRVGQVMMEVARCAVRLERRELAESSCKGVIDDFIRIVEICESSDFPPLEEHEIALRQLADAITLYGELSGPLDAETQRLLARCSALLHASPDEPTGKPDSSMNVESGPEDFSGKPPAAQVSSGTDFRCFGCGGVIGESDDKCAACGWTWK